ncbi:MAG: cadherin repeat domain-containing protein [Planctomycetaceae bacterium]
MFTYSIVDGGGLTSIATMTVTIEGANDTPSITSSSSASLSENLTTVATIVGQDVDASTTLVYSIFGGADAAKFTIDGSTGVLSFLTAPDFENPTDANSNNVYEVTVAVSDGSLSTTQAVSITILDVASSLVVTTAVDNNDSGIASGSSYTNEWLNANKGTDGKISLREAIIAANNTAGADTITFNLAAGGSGYVDPTPGSPGSGDEYWSISVQSALPTITSAVVLDGTSQAGFTTKPVIELNGTSAGAAVDGLTLAAGSGGSTIRGFVINRFLGDGIDVTSSANTIIAGNYIGTDITGTLDNGNTLKGIRIVGSDNIQIGGTTAADRNVISGNNDDGIHVTTSNFALIQGNFIGLNAAGNALVTNSDQISGTDGIAIVTSNYITIGGTTATNPGGAASGAANVVSGMKQTEIWLYDSDYGNVQGNYIGTNAAGTAALAVSGSKTRGLFVSNGSDFITIGGSSANARNIISGNTAFGIAIGQSSGGANSGTIQGNYIGLDTTGTQAIGNAYAGILVQLASNNFTIGGTAAGEGNVIAGTYFGGIASGYPDGTWGGIVLFGGANAPANTVVRGNSIGTDAAGNSGVAFGNGRAGILVAGAVTNTQIGGTSTGSGNVITGSTTGVEIMSRLTGGATYTPSNVAVLRNSIYGNSGLGIDLTRDIVDDTPITANSNVGVTANDTGDSDTGPNGFQNFSVLSSVSSHSGSSYFIGTLNSNPSTTYRIEFFSSPAADSSGYGEGQTYLGSTTVTTDASGDASFNVVLSSLSLTTGHVVSATATVDLGAGSFGATSEFSASSTVIASVAPVISNLSGDILSYSEDSPATILDQSTATVVTDADSTDFAGGSLTIGITAGGVSSDDVLSIRHQGTGAGQIGVSGNDVLYGGVTIGTMSGGSNGTALIIALNSAADVTSVSALLQNITYLNLDVQNPVTTTRTLQWTLTDGDGGTSQVNSQIQISRANDAPVITIGVGDSDTSSVNETNSTLTTSGTLTVTDVDLENVVTAQVSGIALSGTTAGLISNAATLQSMLTVTPTVIDNTHITGTLSWTFNSASESFDYLAAGQSR